MLHFRISPSEPTGLGSAGGRADAPAPSQASEGSSSGPAEASEGALPQPDFPDGMLQIAKRAYRRACRKTTLLGAGVSSDPAWKMLLDLYISMAEDRLISVSDVCVGSGTNSATALRYLSLLERDELVKRYADPLDRRRYHVRLTDQGLAMVRSLLS